MGAVINVPAANQGGLTANVIRVAAHLMQRLGIAGRLGQQFGGKRQLYEALGYKKSLDYLDYWAKFERQDIAGRIVNAPPEATWRRPPELQEDKDDTDDTPFEEAWKALVNRLGVWHYLERVDRLAGIGRYAVLVIGVRGQGDLSQPVKDGSLKSPDDILYLSPFSEKSAQINKWVTDAGDPRFGRPESYRIDFGGDMAGAGFSAGQQIVHHSRVLHVAENLLEDEVFGEPRLRRPFNRLDDLEKVVGGAAEMFWQGAFRGLQANLEADAHLGPDEEQALTAEIEEYVHGLRRFIRTKGMELHTLSGEVADPTGTVNAEIALISAATGIPQRILLGSEAGELASSQDESNWNARIVQRQQNFADPRMIRPLVDRFIAWGALPKPVGGYTTTWKPLFELSETQRAELADKVAGAAQKVAPFGQTELVLAASEFRERYLGLPPQVPVDSDNQPDELDEGPDEVDEEFAEQVRGNRRGGGRGDP